jgi:hypothetical protein
VCFCFWKAAAILKEKPEPTKPFTWTHCLSKNAFSIAF